MLNVVLLFAAAALVGLSSSFASGALLANKIDLDNVDNSLKPNVVPAPKRHHVIRKYVHIYTAPPETVRVAPGQRTELLCQVIGSPNPSVTWLKNGEPLMDYEEETNEILPSHPSSLARLTSKLILTAPSDGDVYTCVATAGVKQKSASTTIISVEAEDPNILLEKLLIPPKPVITAFYNEIFQNEGSNVVLPCRVYGKGQLYWQDNNENLVYEGLDSRLRILPSGDLLIHSLRWADMGQYTCVAQNAYGKDVSSTFLYPMKA